MAITKVPCVLMRGGTSKGLVINKKHLPEREEDRNKSVLRIYGSPDIRQIDGIGGGDPLTSKVALIEESESENVDIVYTFGQVSLSEEEIDFKPTCGNMSAAVGLYAVEEGFCKIKEPYTVVRIFNTNTNKMIEVEVPTTSDGAVYEGNYSIDGVPGTAPRINVNFLDSGGSITGKILPTGNVKDTVNLRSGEKYDVSVVDSANTLIFVTADQLNIKGTEIGEEFNQNPFLDILEEIRVSIGVQIGLIEDASIAGPTSHALPKIAVVSKPNSYVSSTGEIIDEEDIDITGRYIAMGSLHQAFAVSGAIAIATACQIPGTVVEDILSNDKKGPIKIGHPAGIIEVEASVEHIEGEYVVSRAAIGRTARRLMEGSSVFSSSLFIEKQELTS
ncbi:2-methylaconitate cis-trans isomerase PrpF family protein [Virgibacillus ndiopensis]|uniref:2-methylaconitate cis-trans isomerase PrpF family protein n=1 Tax=Virgibacillus ndiopensis TaxID=2004408 RepID=UPI000C08BE9C|nr:PrpF domain-containing protein [Virgibacillus ndiopensis]